MGQQRIRITVEGNRAPCNAKGLVIWPPKADSPGFWTCCTLCRLVGVFHGKLSVSLADTMLTGEDSCLIALC